MPPLRGPSSASSCLQSGPNSSMYSCYCCITVAGLATPSKRRARASRVPEDETHHEKHEEDDEKNFRDAGRGGRNAAKAENSGDQGDHEEDCCPVKHGSPSLVYGPPTGGYPSGWTRRSHRRRKPVGMHMKLAGGVRVP